MKRLLLLFISSFLLISCSKNEELLVTWEGIFFDIPFELKIAGPLSKRQKKEVENLIHATFSMADAHFNHWNPQSEISKINSSTALVHPLSDELRSLLLTAQKAYKMTQGYYNPGMRDQIMQAKSSLKAGILPSFSGSIPDGFNTVTITDSITFEQKVSLDLDGIVKGYIVDLITQKLRTLKHTNFLINWSGEIYASGNHPTGRPWKIFIPSLQKEICLKDTALSTSGSEAQNWTIDGKTFTHIINPKNLMPLEIHYQKAITVEGPSCALADALATALLCSESKQNFTSEYNIYY